MWNSVFHVFFSYEIKQDSVTTASHSKRNIALLKQRNILPSKLITLLENTDGCAENYICFTELYLFSMLSQYFSDIIDYVFSAPVHSREVVDVLNST